MLSPLFDTISGETSFAPAWRGHPISERCSVSSSPVAAGVILPCRACLPLRCLFVSARRGIVPFLLPPSASSHRRFSHPTCVSSVHQSRSLSGWVSSAAAYRSHRLGCLSVRSPRVSHPPRLIDTGSGENGGASFACLPCRFRSHLVCPPFRLRRMWDGVIPFCVLSLLTACPPSYDCRAIPLRSMRVVMGSGLGRVRLLPRLFRIPYGFVFFHPIAPPRCPSRFIRPVICLLFKRIEFDAFTIGMVERCLPAYCLLTVIRVPYAARRLISSSHHLIEYASPSPAYRSHPIPSRCRLANGAAVSIAPRFPPRPSCRLTGRECLLGCRAVNSVIAIVGWHSPYRACPPSSHHLIQSLSSPCPLSPVPSCLLALNNPPAPGRGRRRRNSGLRLRVLRRFACFPLCRAAHSLTLVRYCRRPVIGCLAIVAPMSSPLFPSARLFRHRPRYPSLLRVMLSPPLAPPLLVEERGGATGWLRDVGLFGCRCLLVPCRFPTSGDLVLAPSRPRRLVRSCFHACADGGGVRSRAVALPASPFKRFNCF